MKHLTPMLLIVIAGTAQPALAQNVINPLSFLAPTQSGPFGMGNMSGGISNPFGLGALNPLNPINSINPLSPWNSYGGMSNPALSLGALGALNALTPNVLPSSNPFGGSPFNNNSYQGNPFGGNPFGGNPFVRPSQQQPYGMPAFSPSMPSFPNMPFAAQQPTNMMPGSYYPMQQQQGYPYMPYGAQQQSPQQQQLSLGNLFGMQTQPMQQQQAPFANFYGAPQPVQQPPALPNFFGMMQPPAQPVQPVQPVQQPVQQPMQQAFPFNPFLVPQTQKQVKPPVEKPTAPMLDSSKPSMPSAQQPVALPFFFFAPQAGAAASAPVAPVVLSPASEPAAEVKPDEAALPPLDPAAFMQMYMKPGK